VVRGIIERMAEVRRVARSARMVLVIDDGPRSQPPWLTQLQELFLVVTISTLAGASVAIEGQEVAAVILVLDEPSQQPRTWVSALRRHPNLERTAVFVLARDSALVAAELLGLSDVEVIEPEIANFDLSMRVGVPRMSSRPVPKRLSDPTGYSNDTRRLESLLPKGPASESPAAGQPAPSVRPPASGPAPEDKRLQRFARACVERGERGLTLCRLLSERSAVAAERARAAEELGALFAIAKGEAALLSLRELSLLFGMSELLVSRLNAGKGQLVVPRGVVGLLSALLDLGSAELSGASGASALLQRLSKLDVELHRMRLSSAIER
jgi:hypothetical protein